MVAQTPVKRETETRPERIAERRVATPPVDIVEQKDGLLLLADMPGVEPQNIDVQYENGVLTLHGKIEPREKPNMRCLLREYNVTDYHRSFTIGEGIDIDKIEATIKDGVMRLHLPKSEALKPRKIEVKA